MGYEKQSENHSSSATKQKAEMALHVPGPTSKEIAVNSNNMYYVVVIMFKRAHFPKAKVLQRSNPL